jgi:hypothetical protein
MRLPVDDARSLLKNDAFITDMARFSESILDEKTIRKRYGFTDATWEALGADDALVEAIEAEKVRRIRNGQAKRERAQQLVVKAPDVLGTIMLDASASPKHRIDSAKVLDTFADNGPQAAPAGDRFTISIVLSADEKLTFNKSIRPDPNDIDPNDAKTIDQVNTDDTDTTPQGLLAVIAANKRGSDGGGNNVI